MKFSWNLLLKKMMFWQNFGEKFFQKKEMFSQNFAGKYLQKKIYVFVEFAFEKKCDGFAEFPGIFLNCSFRKRPYFETKLKNNMILYQVNVFILKSKPLRKFLEKIWKFIYYLSYMCDRYRRSWQSGSIFFLFIK